MEKESVVRLRITTGGESITTQGGRYFRMVLSDASVRLFFFMTVYCSKKVLWVKEKWALFILSRVRKRVTIIKI